MEQQKKKKVLVLTDYPLSMTGFGRAAKSYLNYLYKLNKYEIVNIAVGIQNNTPDLDRTPWKTIGSVDPIQLNQIISQNDPSQKDNIARMAGYGAFILDQAVKDEKPDVVFLVQDPWGIDFGTQKSWYDRTTCVQWTTLDSLPILPAALEASKKSLNYWVWADFATKGLHKLGQTHVKTVRGPLETKHFYRLSNEQRKQLRVKNNIPENTFIVGFVFRNQLRKSVPNLLQGYKLFKKDNPKQSTRLLLHTSWAEGWNLPRQLEENGINKSEVLTTYVCKVCRRYQVKPFISNEENCPHCQSQKSQCTTNPAIGVTEEQLNEVYNLMDVYCHAFTSGGQEIPVQEAKLTELITLVTNYSCGEDLCQEGAYSLPLDWSEYTEIGTEFKKASTYPTSIQKQLNKVLNMPIETRREWGKKARQWTLDNFSIEVIGKQLEEFIDAAPFTTHDFKEKIELRNPTYEPPEIQDDRLWLKDIYKNILRLNVLDNDSGLNYWLSVINQKTKRQEILNYFRQVAQNENNQLQSKEEKKSPFEGIIDPKEKHRILLIQPESAGDLLLITSLFKSIRERYPRPDWTFYVSTKPEYKQILEGNPYMDKWFPYSPILDNHGFLVGTANNERYFDVAMHPYFRTQKLIDYWNSEFEKGDLI